MQPEVERARETLYPQTSAFRGAEEDGEGCGGVGLGFLVT